MNGCSLLVPGCSRRTKNEQRATFAIAAAICLALLAGCAAGPAPEEAPEQDGPPVDDDTVAVAGIRDAVPRDEPLSRLGNPDVYEIGGRRYRVLQDAGGYHERGLASWYGRKFQGRRTSSGETYDMYRMTAAHRTLPLPSYVRVTNLDNGRQVIVRINDRGPFHSDRLIDLSYAAAMRLDMIGKGTAPVLLEAVEPGEQTVTQAKDPALYLQAGAFSEARNAQALADRLRSYGLERVFVALSDDPEPLYRVRIGPYPDAAALAETRRVLERHGLQAAALRD